MAPLRRRADDNWPDNFKRKPRTAGAKSLQFLMWVAWSTNVGPKGHGRLNLGKVEDANGRRRHWWLQAPSSPLEVAQDRERLQTMVLSAKFYFVAILFLVIMFFSSKQMHVERLAPEPAYTREAGRVPCLGEPLQEVP